MRLSVQVHVRQVGFAKGIGSLGRDACTGPLPEGPSGPGASEDCGCMGLKKPRRGPRCAACGDRLGESAAPISFLAYCIHEPVILLHHLFIGGFGFLFIVVSPALIKYITLFEYHDRLGDVWSSLHYQKINIEINDVVLQVCKSLNTKARYVFFLNYSLNNCLYDHFTRTLYE